VGPERPTVGEADEEVLADRLDPDDRRPDEAPDGRTRLPRPGGHDPAPDEVRAEAVRRSVEGVAFGHGRDFERRGSSVGELRA
jgi:hypothetical protein